MEPRAAFFFLRWQLSASLSTSPQEPLLSLKAGSRKLTPNGRKMPFEKQVCPSRKMSSFLWSTIHHPLSSRHLRLWLQAIHLVVKKKKIDSHKMPFSSKTNGKGPFGIIVALGVGGNPHRIPTESYRQIGLRGIQDGGSKGQKEHLKRPAPFPQPPGEISVW